LSQTELGERAPRFFTNYESRKSNDMTSNPHVSLVFHWGPMQRQIRIEGVVERVSRGESEIYFDSRERGSQIGAWASPQSHSIQSREELEQIVKDVEARFKDQKVVCPPHWGGWRVVPERIEFWQGVKNRLHDRFVFTKSAEGWNVTRLAP
ncbi:MAG: pyridoxamine 5'-phosphate oxidase, partial [Bdellovibrionota bacterium]